MLVVDAFCLAEILLDGPGSEPIRQRLLTDPDLFAPHVIDVEVFGVIRGQHLLGTLDATAARMALNDLESRPCERVGHRLLLLAPGNCARPFAAGMPCTSPWPRCSMPR